MLAAGAASHAESQLDVCLAGAPNEVLITGHTVPVPPQGKGGTSRQGRQQAAVEERCALLLWMAFTNTCVFFHCIFVMNVSPTQKEIK